LFGNAVDGLNALISAARGNYGDAALDGLSAIPGGGLVAGVGNVGVKFGRGVSKILGNVSLAKKASKVDPAQLRRLGIDAERAKADFLKGSGIRPGHYNIGKGADGTVVLTPVKKGVDPVPTGVKWEDFVAGYGNGGG